MNTYFEELYPEIVESVQEDIISSNPNISESDLKSKIDIEYVYQIALDILPDFEDQLSVITESIDGKYISEKGIYESFKTYIDNYNVPSNADSFFKNTAAHRLASWFIDACINDNAAFKEFYVDVTGSSAEESPKEPREGEIEEGGEE